MLIALRLYFSWTDDVVSFLASVCVDENLFRKTFQSLKDQLGRSWDAVLEMSGDILFAELQDQHTGRFAFGISSTPIEPQLVQEFRGIQYV